MEPVPTFACCYVTGVTFDAKGHLLVAPGSRGEACFDDGAGFVARFAGGVEIHVPWGTVSFVEVRGDDPGAGSGGRRRFGRSWLSSPPRAYLAVGRDDGPELVLRVNVSPAELRAHLAPLGSLLTPRPSPSPPQPPAGD